MSDRSRDTQPDLRIALLGYQAPPFRATRDYLSAACLDELEQRLTQGSSCDGILIHPDHLDELPQLRRLASRAAIIAQLPGPIDHAASQAAFRRGADDILPSDPCLDERQVITRFLVATARHQAQDHLPGQDALTGLLDRRQFLSALQHWLTTASGSTALMTLDIDTFRAINDSLGSSAGDQLLKALGARLAELREDGLLCARIGPDQFAVAMRQAGDPVSMTVFAETLLATVRRPYQLTAGGQKIFITASLGLTLDQRDGLSAEELLCQAELALAQARQQGRSMARFEPGHAADAHLKHRLRNKLHSALENREFSVVYQPLVDGHSGAIVGVEALLRWHAPDFGPVSPEVFIPLLEETGLITEVGFWVIEAACEQLQTWQVRGEVDADFSVAINISSKQLHHCDLEAFIRHTITRTAIHPSQLKLELTESLLVVDSELVACKLARLKALGVAICIDDFGTGYASLSYLRQFPIDVLKIDRSFVQNIGGGERDDAIVLAIINLAHDLQYEVVAEGVETAAQRRYLARHDCDALQGFLFGKPMPARDISHRLRATPVARDAPEPAPWAHTRPALL